MVTAKQAYAIQDTKVDAIMEAMRFVEMESEVVEVNEDLLEIQAVFDLADCQAS